MTEPLFGSVSPMWSATPIPSYGYFQAAIPPGGRSLGAISGAISGAVTGAVSPGVGQPAPLTAFAPLTALVPAPVTAALSVGSSEIAVGVTAAALIAAVAMRRGQPFGPTTDQEVEDFLYDAFELLPGASDVEVRCDGGRVTLTGAVPHRRLKRDVGEIAWALPSLTDVQNNVSVVTRRRSRSARENEASVAAPAGGGRKPT